MDDKIKNLIENKNILLFTNSEINSNLPKYVLVRRSDNKLTEGLLTHIISNIIIHEEYGLVEVDNGNGCKVISIKAKDNILYKVLNNEEFNLLKITANTI